MKKRFLSLLCVLALCLGLLPATALAAAPIGQVIYVGNENVTSGGYWTTDSAGNVTQYNEEGKPSNNYIHYNTATNTLTLHNATIKKSVSTNTSTLIAGAAIGVHNQNGAAELTITLEGTNTIAEVGKGIFVLASSTGGATLTITGDGSLDASASQTGIWVQNNSGNATLTIRNAKVEATGTSRGVNVQSHASSTASLTVDGGSLTASGSPGILYDSSSSGTVPNTTTLTISKSAIVDAREGGIGAGYIWNLSGVSPTDDSVGIVFGLDLSDSKAGAVYGDVTLQEDLEIGEGESLTISDGASLNTGSHEVIVNGGTLTGGDKIEGTVKYAPAITTESLPGGTVGEPYTETILAATGDASITWSVSNGSLPAGLSLSKDGKITGTPTTEGTSTFTVTATNNIGSDSREFTLKIEKPAFIPVTDLELNKDSLTLQENSSDTLIATVKPDDATNRGVTWESSDTSIATVSEDGTVTAISAGNATITATAADGSGISASCTLTVTHGNMVQTPKKDATCTVDGTEEYWTCEICGKHFEDERGTIPTTPEENKIQATGHSYGEPVWNWSEDGKTCTVTFTCEKDETHKETPVVKVTSAVKKPATCTETGVTTYTATVEFNGNTYTDTKEVADIPATGHSYDNGKCTVCGAIASDFKVIIAAGANGSWQKGTKDGLTFTSNAAYKYFQKVQVDGKDLDVSNYTVKEGSIIVTLKAEYLETLSVGKHTLAIVSETGTATTEFTVKAAAVTDDTQSPQTGDDSNIALWIAVLLAVGTALTGTAVYSRKRKYSK